jgi:tol-pal system protein YbgF
MQMDDVEGNSLNNASRMQVQLLQLERLVEGLTGQLEEYSFELTIIRKDISQLTNDLLYRLAVLENYSGVSSALSVQSEVIAPTGSNTVTTDNDVSVPGDLSSASEEPLSAPVQQQLKTNNSQSNDAYNASQAFGILKVDRLGEPLVGEDNGSDDIEKQVVVPDRFTDELRRESFGELKPRGVVSQEGIALAEENDTATWLLPKGTPEEQYNFAFNILRKADYSKAEKVLKLFLELNPDHELAGNAQYWIGETFYVRGEFESASVEFLTGYETYPNSAKGPDNLLKLALSMARLEKKDEACASLSKLASVYPSANATVQRRAQTERSRLKCN